MQTTTRRDAPAQAVSICIAVLSLSTCTPSQPAPTDVDPWRASTPLGEEVLIIASSEDAPRVRQRVVQLLRAYVSGDHDDEPGQDHWAPADLRVTVVTPERAAAFAQEARCLARDSEDAGAADCAQTTVPSVRYRWAPYGYADDVDAFVANVDCLLGALTDNCTPQPTAANAGRPRADAPFEAWLVATRDVCTAAADSGDCDPALTSLLARWPRYTYDDGSPLWWPRLIFGMPREVLWNAVPGSRSEFVRELVQDPRMQARASDICRGSGELRALPGVGLLERFSEDGGGFISVCAADYRPLLDMETCAFSADWAALGIDDLQHPRDDAGLYPCELEELLPSDGPLTQCSQLADHGRDPKPLRIYEAREVCRVQQVSEADGLSGVAGWYAGEPPLPAAPGAPHWAWMHACASIGRPRRPLDFCTDSLETRPLPVVGFGYGKDYIPGTYVRLRCENPVEAMDAGCSRPVK